LVGSGLILGSAGYVAMQRGAENNGEERHPHVGVVVSDEERGMMQDVEGIDDREGESDRDILLGDAESTEGEDEENEQPEVVQGVEAVEGEIQ